MPASNPRSALALRLGLPGLGLLLLAGLWGALAAFLHFDSQRSEEELRQRVQGAASAHHVFVERNLGQLDLLLRALAQQVQQHGRPELDWFGPAGARPAGLKHVYVTDAEGQILASDIGSLSEAASTAVDRPYFQQHRRGQVRGLFVGPPTQSRVSGEWRLHLSRAWVGADGRFGGVVVASIDPAYLTSAYSPSQLGQSGLLGVVGLDWLVRARRSGDQLLFGESIRNGQLYREVQRAPEGRFEARSPLDQLERQVAYRLLPEFEVVSYAALGKDEFLAPLHARQRRLLGIGGVASLALLAAFWALSAVSRRLERSRVEAARARMLFQTSADAQLDALLIFQPQRDAQGRLVNLRCVHANRAACEWLTPGQPSPEGRSLLEALPRELAAPLFTQCCTVIESGQPLVTDLDLSPLLGRRLIASQHLVAVGEGAALSLRDITKLREKESEALYNARVAQRSERLLAALTDAVPVMLVHLNRELRVTFANEACARWLGPAWAMAEGKTLHELLSPEIYEARLPHVQRALRGETVEFVSERQTEQGGRIFKNSYVPDLDPLGRCEGVYAVSADVTELKQTEERLSELAFTDTLTGLRNRRFVADRLPQMLSRARRTGLGVGVIYLDIDRFKRVNDEQGHAVGDAVLQEFARRLRASTRLHDVAARFAGDEFVVLLEDLRQPEDMVAVAQKFLAALRPNFELADGVRLQVSASLGLAFSTSPDTPPEALLREADAALYEAKARGRNTYVLGAGGAKVIPLTRG